MRTEIFAQDQLHEFASFTDPQNEIIADLASELIMTRNVNDELVRRLSALQLSQDNIINALGIKGEGAHSKQVIEYVMGLVAEIIEGRIGCSPKPLAGWLYDAGYRKME